jgi:muramidase (phage lysozyme)
MSEVVSEQQQGPVPPPEVQRYAKYSTMSDDTMTRAGVPLGVLRDLVIGNESKSTAQARGVEPYDVLAIGPGVEHNARQLPVNEQGFPDRAPVKSAWGYPSTGAGAYQFEKETYGDVAKVLGIKDFSKASQDAVFNYIATTPYGGKSGVFPWEKNTRLMPALRSAQQQYAPSRMAQSLYGKN